MDKETRYKNIALEAMRPAWRYATDIGRKANIDRWYANKRQLIEALSRHPNWSEEDLAVVIDIEETRGVDKGIATDSLRDLERITGVSVNSEVLTRLESRALTEADVTMLQQAAEEGGFEWPVEFKSGQKVSRLVRKLFTALGVDLDREQECRRLYTRYADAVNPLSTVRPFAFSVNPADYLLMSNGNSWTSCHDIEDGSYRTGTLSYMNDAVSVVSFTVQERLGNTPLSRIPKVTRQMYHVDPSGEAFIQARLYPVGYSQAEFRKWRGVVHKILAEAYGFDNKWGKPMRNLEEFMVQEDNTHYPDYLFSRSVYSFHISLKEGFEERHVLPHIHIGRAGICMDCGTHGLYDSSDLLCEYCLE